MKTTKLQRNPNARYINDIIYHSLAEVRKRVEAKGTANKAIYYSGAKMMGQAIYPHIEKIVNNLVHNDQGYQKRRDKMNEVLRNFKKLLEEADE